jgi:hypothetical protein
MPLVVPNIQLMKSKKWGKVKSYRRQNKMTSNSSD